ncbi:MAG: Crp/Fnr family transcriptional regulator [Nitrospiraceae bacterium]|nr:MAG: Crp/Fnr family transcriptional regulator [Nitrospiraceae bacterium]
MRKKTSDFASLMADVSLFQGLAGGAFHMLERILVKRGFARGENVFTEGSESTGFYIILRGRVKVYKLSPEGKEQILHIVRPNELLGAVPAFSGSPYLAHADALEKTQTYFFPRKDFLALIKREPSVVMNMMANLAMRLQHFTRLIEDLSLREVPGRLAAYLLYLCDRTGCGNALEMDISKGQLASLLGTIPETLSRILRRLSEKKIIQVRGRKISLLNKKALQDIVGGEKVEI